MRDRDHGRAGGRSLHRIRDERFGVTGEVSGLVQRGAPARAQGLVALNDNVSRALVLDVALAAGLSRAAPDWQLMAGMTVRLGHWF
jgi:hypothetical protein